MARAGLVLAGFVIATVLLLGVVHPTTVKPASSETASAATGPATSAATSPTTAPSSSGSSHHTSGATTTTVIPSKVPVLVANASGVTGAAAAVTAELQPSGWNLGAPVNASEHVTTSTVYYLAGQQQAALEIASELHLPSSSVAPYTTAAPISSIGTAEVLVVVGPDLASRATSPTTSAPATTTTAARTTTTTHH